MLSYIIHLEVILKMANDKQNKTSEAQLRAIKKYEEKQKELVDNIRVRDPHGWKDLLVQYVKEHPEYNSVNALLTDMIREKLNIKD